MNDSVDGGQLVWSWLNGLVRRATIGTLFFFIFSAVSALLVIAAAGRETDLRNLDGYSQLQAHYTDAFLEMAGLGADLTGIRASQMQPIEPLKRALNEAQRQHAPGLACAGSWLKGLEDLQLVPLRLGNVCAQDNDTCDIPHDKIVLADLIAFERGIGAVQDGLPALDRFCFSSAAKASICSYYVDHRDKEISGLRTLVEKHYRQSLSEDDRRLLRVRRSKAECPASSGFLANYAAVVTAIDPAARPRTLTDFEKLGESISARRVAIQSEDTRVSSAPAGGLFTLLVPRDVSLPVLYFFGFLSILYGFLNIRRLDRLSTSTELGDERRLYKLYIVASHIFTAPVFGAEGLAKPPSSWISKVAALLAGALFNWIPVTALFISFASLAAAAMLVSSSGFSLLSVVATASIAALQAIATAGFMRERQALRGLFNLWTADPVPTQDQQSTGDER